MAIPSGLLIIINKDIADLVADMAGRQPIYFTTNGRFWQGIKTPDRPPRARPDPPDKSRRPTDQAESWDDFGVDLPPTVRAALVVDVYDGPLGHGYVVRSEVETGAAELWEKAINVGSETHRGHGWTQQDTFP